MKKLTANEQIVANDILRYKKNKLASTLAILGLVFNCLYFLLLYAMPGSEFTTISIGFSVMLTLIMLLTIFLSSEGVKGYNKKFSIVLLVCAAFQIVRIFYYPLKGIKDNLFVAASAGQAGMNYIGYFGWYPSFTNPTSTVYFVLMLIYLVASAACLIGAAVWGFIVAMRLEKFQKQLDNGEISIKDALVELDKEDEAAAAAAAVAEVETVKEVSTVKEETIAETPAVEEEAVKEEPTADVVQEQEVVAEDKPSSEVE